jgi:hypothetical protein
MAATSLAACAAGSGAGLAAGRSGPGLGALATGGGALGAGSGVEDGAGEAGSCVVGAGGSLCCGVLGDGFGSIRISPGSTTGLDVCRGWTGGGALSLREGSAVGGASRTVRAGVLSGGGADTTLPGVVVGTDPPPVEGVSPDGAGRCFASASPVGTLTFVSTGGTELSEPLVIHQRPRPARRTAAAAAGTSHRAIGGRGDSGRGDGGRGDGCGTGAGVRCSTVSTRRGAAAAAVDRGTSVSATAVAGVMRSVGSGAMSRAAVCCAGVASRSRS